MKRLRSDNGREYCNVELQDYLKERGILFKPSARYTQEQNGRAERSNRTITECARTMLLASGLPHSLWAEAVNCAVYMLKRVSIVKQCGGTTAFELRTRKKPNLQHAGAFGSVAYTHIPKLFTRKFDTRAKKLHLVGYEKESSNYRVYDHGTKKVTVSRNVIFSNEIGLVEKTEDQVPLVLTSNQAKDEPGGKDDPVAGEEEEANPAVVEADGQGAPAGAEQPKPADVEQPVNRAQPAAPSPPNLNLRDRSTLKRPMKYSCN